MGENYDAVNRKMEIGDLLFVDYGAAEYRTYGSDICRTFPVSGKFSPDQKFKIIKEQMTTKTSITEICKKYDISAGKFYKWQEKFLKGALK